MSKLLISCYKLCNPITDPVSPQTFFWKLRKLYHLSFLQQKIYCLHLHGFSITFFCSISDSTNYIRILLRMATGIVNRIVGPDFLSRNLRFSADLHRLFHLFLKHCSVFNWQFFGRLCFKCSTC